MYIYTRYTHAYIICHTLVNMCYLWTYVTRWCTNIICTYICISLVYIYIYMIYKISTYDYMVVYDCIIHTMCALWSFKLSTPSLPEAGISICSLEKKTINLLRSFSTSDLLETLFPSLNHMFHPSPPKKKQARHCRGGPFTYLLPPVPSPCPCPDGQSTGTPQLRQ